MSGGSSAAEPPRPHRPALFADLTEMIDAAQHVSGASRAEVAAATAEVVVRAGRNPGDRTRFVGLADRVGIDTLASLWREADPVSLPGVLWVLYLLRHWCRSNGDEVVRLWRTGEPLAPADAVVAGVAAYADATALEAFADATLTGVYQGDLAVALERAAAFFRVVALGRRSLRDPEPGAFAESSTVGASGRTPAQELAGRNDRVAGSLAAAAARWRAGTLH